MLEQTDILVPMVMQMILMIIVAFWLVWARVGSVARGKVIMEDVAREGWKGWIKQAGDNYSNQFELPVLFFAACLVLFVSNNVSEHAVHIAWAFVVLRIIHAFVHLTFNHILARFVVFFLGAIALMALVWLCAMAVF